MTATHLYYMTNLLPQSALGAEARFPSPYNLRSSGRDRRVQRGNTSVVYDRLNAAYIRRMNTTTPTSHSSGAKAYGLAFLSTAGFFLGYVLGNELSASGDITLEQALVIGIPTGIACLIPGLSKTDGIAHKPSPKELFMDAIGYTGLTAGISLAGLGYGLVDKLS
ncbi:hypothetical protein HYY69_06230 [Candidatus Woesearchaeota archaeon]|nr:hypothetical protein [Candidatus Woesearchaeota archaeon]